jgi:iron-sulfur cluster protein
MPVNKKFRKKVQNALGNTALRTALGNFALSYPQARESAYNGLDFQGLREEIERIKTGAVDHIEALADRFEQQLSGRGARVHRAKNGEEVAQIIKQIARQRSARLCVKSKSMATEEVRLNHRLRDVLKVVETDLGEWIIQQIDERPSHMVMPAIHLSKEKCAEIFSKVVGEEITPDIPRMVKLARQLLRAEFLAADIGISGCNIAVAETGTMVIFTNEGNGRLTATLPPVHIVLLGYEKLVPRFKDIAPLAAAIPRSATCQYLTSYVTMISAPTETFKGPGDGEIVAKELHVILLDNGRLELLKDPLFKKIGQCIRCASCLNVCPVYTLVGGQVFGDVYAGGIGALLTAFFSSPAEAEKIQEMCLTCGKCRETCPGNIDIPGLILQLRSQVRSQIPPPFLHKIAIETLLPHKKKFDFPLRAAGAGLRYFGQRFHLPSPAPKSFRALFKTINQKILQPKGTIAFFYGCLIDYLYPEIGTSIVFLLNQAGYRVILPRQTCCGAPALYMGLEQSAQKLVEQNLHYLANHTPPYDHILTACPTGTAMLNKHWPHPTARRAIKSFDQPFSKGWPPAGPPEAIRATTHFIKFIHRLQNQGTFPLGPLSPGKEIKITYHHSCHLKRECGIENEPRDVLSAIPGVRWLEMEEADRCCGFAGAYSLKLPEISSELVQRKIKNIEKSGAEIVVVDCPGCLLWLRRGLEKAKSKIQVLHSAVFLVQYASGGQGALFEKTAPWTPTKTFY